MRVRKYELLILCTWLAKMCTRVCATCQVVCTQTEYISSACTCAPCPVSRFCDGSAVTTGYRMYTQNGQLTLTEPALMDILLVAGGGGGGHHIAGGGGAGGVVHAVRVGVPSGTYNFVIGGGGLGGQWTDGGDYYGTNGGDTNAFGAVVRGGGAGGGTWIDPSPGRTGGCGGGGASNYYSDPIGGSVTANTIPIGTILTTGRVTSYGNAGGTGANAQSNYVYISGGGGGALSSGQTPHGGSGI